MKITILTLFPEFFTSGLEVSILKRAQAKGLVSFTIIPLREYGIGPHRLTDDRPFGGGPGMVMKLEPIFKALSSLGVVNDAGLLPPDRRPTNSQVWLLSAKGTQLTQPQLLSWSQIDDLILICGHYEGVDERVASHLVDGEVRIGDYVLTGGEPAALVVTDAVTRLIPGVLGNEASPVNESHAVPGQLGFPQYTRPEVFQTWRVPAPLLSGHHAQIEEWRANHRTQDKVE